VTAAAVVLLAAPTARAGGVCLQAVSLEPAAGSGQTQIFDAVYAHCMGAQTFRIVQIWFGSEVAIEVPHTGGSFENGLLSWDTQQCVPGDPVSLVTEHSTLDCAQTTVTSIGNEMHVQWAVEFDVDSFAGPQNIFFDAKGGAGDPEPRLGWTQVGTFTVQAEAAGDDSGSGGGGDDSGSGGTAGGIGGNSGGDGGSGGTSETSAVSPAGGLPGLPGDRGGDTGCACRSGGGPRGGPSEDWLGGLVLLALLRRRRQQ
jgi:MYXO-CTERM domain-containing protein